MKYLNYKRNIQTLCWQHYRGRRWGKTRHIWCDS